MEKPLAQCVKSSGAFYAASRMPEAHTIEITRQFFNDILSKQTNAYFLSRPGGRLSDSWATAWMRGRTGVEIPDEISLAANLHFLIGSNAACARRDAHAGFA
jgi:hypothetical protein